MIRRLFRYEACLAALAGALLLSAPARAVTDIAAPEAFAAAESGQMTLVDIRTPPEWRETGVGKGVRRLDMLHPGGAQGFMADLLKQVGGDRNAPIALICRTGNRTTQVARYLEAQGFTRIYNIKEGMAGSAAGPGWLRRGLPVEPCAC
ncbi:MAG TPA: rhodanese-like domain-containing protein [Rhodocyclaceae bacterium]|nr:rhodanese-like domain-containing protein [Rhodocyclaceae bacterium]